MEFCEKGSLFNVLKDPELPLSWDLVFSMLEETVAGIVALHSFNPPILHRDLKTLNVLVTADNKCKVCDFGLSRFDTGSNVDTLLKCRGTLAYVAYEVYQQQGFFPQSDVYSLAIVMWEVVNRCITGEYLRPYHDIKMEFVILTQAHQRNRRPALPETVPNSLKELITICWDADYKKRPDAKVLHQQLIRIHQEYNQNKEYWSSICHYTKNPPPVVPTVTVNGEAVPMETRSEVIPERPKLRRGGGGSVSPSSALSLMGVPHV
jgi:serine/threonine protein kinase